MRTVQTLGFIPRAEDHDAPAMVVNEVVRLDRCDCVVCFGTRDDTGEFAMAALPCVEDGHTDEMEEFLMKFRETLKEPRDVPASDVAMEILSRMGVR
jgi:hypothetical protein